MRTGTRRSIVVSLLALTLLAPSQVSAQALQSFEDLALRINLDDQLLVEDQSGVKTSGRLTRLTLDEIALQTDAGEKRFARDAVRAVALRGHPLRNGALIGAAVFAVLGAVANCSHEGNDACVAVGSLAAAPIGAGVGLAVGALVPRMRTIYRAPESPAPPPGPRAAGGGHAGLLEDLGLRVNLDDQLRVEDPSGGRTSGRLTRLTANDITILTGAGEKHFTRDTVRQVAVRHHPLRMGVLIGAGVGAVAGAIAGCTGEDREECADAPIMVGALGAGVGLAVGALTHTTRVVYPEAQTRTALWPMISHDAVGIGLSRSW
jgi:hypothetical protein